MLPRWKGYAIIRRMCVVSREESGSCNDTFLLELRYELRNAERVLRLCSCAESKMGRQVGEEY